MSFRSALLFSVLLFGYLYWSLAQPANVFEIRCKVMEPISDPSVCKYGSFYNACDKLDCFKGPGDKCGDNVSTSIRYGKCAPGLSCCNSECKGCINGNCYSVSCHPSHAMGLRSDPYMPERHVNPLYRIFDYYSNE
ncbi:neuroparsin-A-like [Anopheles moucheti]|uniref:neuroparsin-A-like n=1 Tax=Anopheles moucheti TaxID=186751 RepID=UPI0022F0918B|nr:neuroparsin-A-like [Anopheles moucheti]